MRWLLRRKVSRLAAKHPGQAGIIVAAQFPFISPVLGKHARGNLWFVDFGRWKTEPHVTWTLRATERARLRRPKRLRFSIDNWSRPRFVDIEPGDRYVVRCFRSRKDIQEFSVTLRDGETQVLYINASLRGEPTRISLQAM